MKRILLLIIFSFLQFSSFAQSWQWAKRLGGDTIANQVIDIAVDAHHNVYSLATVGSKFLDVDGHSIAGYGGRDILLSSFNCAGQYRWSKIIGNSLDSDVAVAVKVDNSGGVYVCGSMNISAGSSITGAHIDADTFIGNTNKMIFLAKWDTSGRYQWLKMPQPDTISHNSALNESLAVDMDFDSKNMCIMAWITNGLYGGTINVPTTGTYILKYDKSGLLQAAISIPITIASNNPSYFTKSSLRYNQSTQQFVISGRILNSTTIGGIAIPSGSGYIASFDANSGGLKFLDYQKGTPYAGGTFSDRATIDSKGDVYIGGFFYDSCQIAGVKYYNGTYGINQTTPLILKLNGTTGNIIWGINGCSYGQGTVGSPVVVDNQLYAGGAFGEKLVFGIDSVMNGLINHQDGFLLKLDPNTGSVLQLDSVQYSNSQTGFLSRLTTFGKYSFISGGRFADKIAVGSTVLQQNLKGAANRHSLGDAVIAKYGYADCQACSEAAPTFTSSFQSGNTFQYRYTGTIVSVDSIRWVWGDGKQQTVKTNFTYPLTHSFPGKGSYSVCITVYADTCGSKQYCGTSKLSVGSSTMNEVKIYPNPTPGIVTIDGLEIGAELDLQSIVGQSLLKEKVTREKQKISLNNFPQGTYLLRIIFKNGTSSFSKLIKL
ncbi:MAG: T9SS type A sorting domain-containing protein [Chitinophagaceae bacterium]